MTKPFFKLFSAWLGIRIATRKVNAQMARRTANGRCAIVPAVSRAAQALMVPGSVGAPCASKPPQTRSATGKRADRPATDHYNRGRFFCYPRSAVKTAKCYVTQPRSRTRVACARHGRAPRNWVAFPFRRLGPRALVHSSVTRTGAA